MYDFCSITDSRWDPHRRMHYYIKRVSSADVSNQDIQKSPETPIVGNVSSEDRTKGERGDNDVEVTEDGIGDGGFDDDDGKDEEEDVDEVDIPPVEKRFSDKNGNEEAEADKGNERKDVSSVEERTYFQHSGRTPQSSSVRYVVYD
jgi:hypothetical protein